MTITFEMGKMKTTIQAGDARHRRIGSIDTGRHHFQHFSHEETT